MIPRVLYQPSIELFGIVVQEPVTSITDLLVSLTCFIAYRRIARQGRTNEIYRFFKYFFLMMALSTCLGGLIGHAFFYAFDFQWKLPGWIVSMISIMFVERAVIFHARQVMRPSLGKILSLVNIIELVVFIVLAMSTLNFSFVEIHAAYGFLLVVLPLEIFVYVRTKDRGSLMMFGVVFLAALSAFIHIAKISISQWFNHLDISHVVMIMAIIALFGAMKRMNIFEGSVSGR